MGAAMDNRRGNGDGPKGTDLLGEIRGQYDSARALRLETPEPYAMAAVRLFSLVNEISGEKHTVANALYKKNPSGNLHDITAVADICAKFCEAFRQAETLCKQARADDNLPQADKARLVYLASIESLNLSEAKKFLTPFFERELQEAARLELATKFPEFSAIKTHSLLSPNSVSFVPSHWRGMPSLEIHSAYAQYQKNHSDRFNAMQFVP